MKKIIVLLAFLLSTQQVSAQGFWSIANKVDSLFPGDTTEDGPKAKVNRIKRRWDGQINAQGTFTTAAQNFKNFSTGLVNFRTQTTNCLDIEPQWKEVGPTMEADNTNSLGGAGLIHRMTFHPNYGNPLFDDEHGFKTMFALSGFGGIWKSIDDGENWTRLNTDLQIPFSSVGVLVIDPVNPDRMYVTTGTPNGAPDVNYYTMTRDFPLFTIGIYATDDGGVNWHQINNGLSALTGSGGSIYNLQLDPNNRNSLIFTSTDGVYISANAPGSLIGLGSIAWTKDLSFTFSDTKIQGLTYNITQSEWFVSGMDIYHCVNPFVSHSWQLATGISKGLNLTGGNYQGYIKFPIEQINVVNSPFYPDEVYALLFSNKLDMPGDGNYVSIYKMVGKNLSGTQWQFVTHSLASATAGGLHSDKIPFVKSPTLNNYYCGSTHFASLLGGVFSETYGNAPTTHHADIQGLYIHPSQPTKIWICSDGGVCVGTVGSTHNSTVTYKNKGIQSQLLWDYDDSENDPKFRMGALQDNGVQYTGGLAGNSWKMNLALSSIGDGYISQILDKNALDAFFKGTAATWWGFNYQTGGLAVFPAGTGAYYFSDPQYPTEKVLVGSLFLKTTSGSGSTWNQSDVPNTPSILLNYIPKTFAYSGNPDRKTFYKAAYPRYTGTALTAYAISVRTGYQETWVTDPMPSLLFKSTNGFNSQWIGSSLVNYFSNISSITNALYDAAKLAGAIATTDLPQLSGVTCKPEDGNKVWVSSGGLLPQFKVWKSVDGGINWADADVGDAFANIPVFDVLAVEGSMDLVFAATLDGVYYTDNTMSGNWCRYGASPSVQTLKLKINTCKNKLIVTTYGRGAFEVDLPFQPVASYDINTTPVTWSTPMHFPNTSVTVKAGKTLTIQNTTVYFGPNSRLYVEAGAKLILNNAILTSEAGCTNGYVWKGVELEGNINQKQVLSAGYYPNHGWCVMSNNATIEKAEVGVKNFSTVNGDGWTINWSKMGGGIIQSTNGKILNCGEGAKFITYINKNGLNQPINDKSFFTTTQFLTDAATASYNYKPGAHMVMWGTRGIGITSNTFKNVTPSSYLIKERGLGIVAYDAIFTTGTPCLSYLGSGDCGTYGTRNTFENLHYGVDAGASLATIIDNVNVCAFTNNHRGIIFRGTTSSKAFRNNISVGDAYMESTGVGTSMATVLPYGIYLDACDAYGITENVITDASGTNPDTDYGIIVNYTGLNTNEIKLNTFSHMAYGIQAQEENYGLQLKCNKFTTSTIKNADIKIMGLQMDGSIAQQQGACITGDATALPGNEFSHTCSAAQDLSTNSTVLYQVTYNTRSTVPVEVPQTGCYNTTDYVVNLCGSPATGSVCPPGGGEINRNAQSNPDKQLSDMTKLIAAKQQLIMEGNAQSLRNDMLSGANETIIKQKALQKGPYLSDDLLVEMIHHTPVYSDEMLQDILTSNSPLSSTVMNAVNSSAMDSKTKDHILTYQKGVSQRRYVENEITFYKNQRVLLYNEMINEILNDTTGLSYDSLYKKLNFEISPQSRNLYIAALIDQGNYNGAQAELENMKQAGESVENCNYMEALISLKQQPNAKKTYETNGSISSKIDPLLKKWPLGKSVNANVLHSSLFGDKYDEQIYVDPSTKSEQLLTVEEPKKIASENNLQVLTYPNPANNEIVFLINGSAESDGCTIMIYDINGKLMSEFSIKENKTPKTILLDEYSSGVYFYKAMSGNKTTQDKLIIIK
ncbi:MAG: T9SS type A sorting domain-containing protein [Bacteroidota bacterium]